VTKFFPQTNGPIAKIGENEGSLHLGVCSVCPEIRRSEDWGSCVCLVIEPRLISAATGAIFIPRFALSGSDTGGLNATLAMKITLVITEIKRRSIWG
jgi:hypothetical protein